MTYVISLGGVGGCPLAEALRTLNYLAHPYDWLISTQSFILRSFNNFDRFFIFNNTCVHNNTMLLDYDKKGIMLHDFNNFTIERHTVIEKYKRRFDRLNKALNSKSNILFVRIFDTLSQGLRPEGVYDNILYRDDESILIWEEFINNIKNIYNKNINLLILTSTELPRINSDNIDICLIDKNCDSTIITTAIKYALSRFQL
jgi:hypothetical protein